MELTRYIATKIVLPGSLVQLQQRKTGMKDEIRDIIVKYKEAPSISIKLIHTLEHHRLRLTNEV